MSRPDEIPPDVGAARMLAEALRAALAAGADAESFTAARTAAQIAGLDGLDACMAALEPHRGAPWPAPFAAIADRVLRLTSAGRLQGFRDADRELGAHAAEASGMHWERAAVVISAPLGATTPAEDEAKQAGASVATVSVAEALEELPLAGVAAEAIAQRIRLTVPVAAALRAALEWLTREVPQPKPFVLRDEDSVLEVVCDAISAAGLAPAHEALAAADGNLSPLGDGPPRAAGAWRVRVPAWSPRPLHLMFEQGPLRLAVPWHSVLRMSLVPAIELELRRESLATPMLEPLATLIEGIGERPVIAIASGAKRGLLVADRLVWRLAAEPFAAPDSAPHALLSRAVQSEEGDVFWQIDSRLLLERLPVPVLPPAESTPPAKPTVSAPPPKPTASVPPPPKLAPNVVELKPLVSAPAPPLELRAEDVEPLTLSAADVVPLDAAPANVAPPLVAAPTPPIAAPAAVAPPVVAPPVAARPPIEFPAWMERLGSPQPAVDAAPESAAPLVVRSMALASRAVLIAEDSLAARHFLARLFEREGFEPQAVASAGELCRALATRAWSLVAVDVELPDAHGVTWLNEVRTELERADVPCVALVRDDQDAELAREAGISRWLKKPFDREELARLLRVARLIPGASA